MVDGIDVKDWELSSLRKNISITTQDVFLFSDTVYGNISYGNINLTEDEVKYFASLSLVNFADKLSNGYNTIIGERGVGISGGQKQRICFSSSSCNET